MRHLASTINALRRSRKPQLSRPFRASNLSGWSPSVNMSNTSVSTQRKARRPLLLHILSPYLAQSSCHQASTLLSSPPTQSQLHQRYIIAKLLQSSTHSTIHPFANALYARRRESRLRSLLPKVGPPEVLATSMALRTRNMQLATSSAVHDAKGSETSRTKQTPYLQKTDVPLSSHCPMRNSGLGSRSGSDLVRPFNLRRCF